MLLRLVYQWICFFHFGFHPAAVVYSVINLKQKENSQSEFLFSWHVLQRLPNSFSFDKSNLPKRSNRVKFYYINKFNGNTCFEFWFKCCLNLRWATFNIGRALLIGYCNVIVAFFVAYLKTLKSPQIKRLATYNQKFMARAVGYLDGKRTCGRYNAQFDNTN